MAIEWLKLKMPYGARHIPAKTQKHNLTIEAFHGGYVELWFEPTMPTNTPMRFDSVRRAKFHCNKILAE